MASRKDEKERLRTERLAAEQAEAKQARQRMILGYVGAGILGLVVLAGVVVLIAGSGGGTKSSVGGGSDSSCSDPNAHIDLSVGADNGVPCDTRVGTPPPTLKQADLKKAATAAGCKLTLNLPDYGHQHVNPGTKVNYKGEPPTSGNHVFPPHQQADGAYSEEPDPLDFVHSMEHSRVEFEYSKNLPENDQLAIKGVFDQSPSGVLLFPNDQLTDQVAAAAWRNRMNCPKYEGSKTLDALADFRTQFRGVAGREFSFPITP
jgi:uncharacterized protein DUF3105